MLATGEAPAVPDAAADGAAELEPADAVVFAEELARPLALPLPLAPALPLAPLGLVLDDPHAATRKAVATASAPMARNWRMNVTSSGSARGATSPARAMEAGNSAQGTPRVRVGTDGRGSL